MHTGILEIDYKGSVKRIEYSLQLGSYGGLPLLTIEDKNKRHYPFVRGTHNGWHSLTKEPNWPRDFLDILYYAFEEKYNELKQQRLQSGRKEPLKTNYKPKL